MKVREAQTHDERQVHEIEEQLPEVPADVRIPDDISGLDERGGRAASGVRWLRWMAPVVVVVLAVVTVALLIRDRGSDQVELAETTTSYQLVQESIEEALAERQVVGPNAGLAEVHTVEELAVMATSYELVQESIDQALADMKLGRVATSYEMVQQAIEDALDERQE
jgi:hypothetical protein